jgi:hypothetical protein
MRDKIMVRLALAVGSLFLLASSASASPYVFQTLNNPGDPAFNQLLGINNAGTIVGYFGDGIVQPNQGYTLSPPYSGGYTAENFPGSAQTQVVGINSSGTTVGFYVDGNGNNFGFVNHGGTFQSISDPNTPAGGTVTNQLLGVNASNMAAGFYVNASGNSQGYVVNLTTSAFTAVNLPASFNAVSAVATGIDNAGVISGFFTDAAGNTHGFLDNGGTFTQIDDPGGTNTMVFGLNNNQMAVGSFVDANGETQGFVDYLTTDLFQTISDPNSSANPAFDVTGTTLNGINDQGDLVGFYSDGTNVNGFLATPSAVPEPATWMLLATGCLGIARVFRKKLIV